MTNNIEKTMFNKGEAKVDKIFDEVDKIGHKIVVKNDKPICVFIAPKAYEDMIDLIEDYELMFEAEKRLRDEHNTKYYSMEEVMKMHGITQEELDAIPDVQIE